MSSLRVSIFNKDNGNKFGYFPGDLLTWNDDVASLAQPHIGLCLALYWRTTTYYRHIFKDQWVAHVFWFNTNYKKLMTIDADHLRKYIP